MSHSQDEALNAALEKVRKLELSRDAMLSSIESLKVLVSNERAVARVAKRKLAATTKSLEKASDTRELSEKLEVAEASLRERQSEIEHLRTQNLAAAKEEERLQEREEKLRIDLSTHEKTIQENDTLRKQLHSSRKELESNARLVEKQNQQINVNHEKAMEKLLKEKDESIYAIETQLRDERARAEALSTTVEEIPVLRTRIQELEDIQHDTSKLDFFDQDESEVFEELDESTIQKKLFELKIARNVIAEKDKTFREVRDKVKVAEARELEAVLACRVSEQQAKNAEDALCEAKSRLGQMQLRLDTEIQSRTIQEQKEDIDNDSLQSERKKMSGFEDKFKQQEQYIAQTTEQNKLLTERAHNSEQNLQKAKDELEVLAVKVRELEEDKTTDKDAVEEHERVIKARADELVTEARNLKAALSISEKEVARLESVLATRVKTLEHPGDSSPCSTDAGLEEHSRTSPINMVNTTDSEYMEKIVQLEEVVRLAKSSYEQKCLEAQAFASSVSDNATTIVTLNRALLVSRNSCDEKHKQLEESMARANSLDKTVRTLKSEISSRNEECDFLENRIRFELEPSLIQANGLLDQRTGELKTLRDEYEMLKEESMKRRVALEQETSDLSERLETTADRLKDSNKNFTAAERNIADLEKKMGSLSEEKQRSFVVIEDLTSQCEHRRQALLVLQERLVEIETNVATREQVALDAEQTVRELCGDLSQVRENLAVAEDRAFRSDILLESMEQRSEELERSHISVMDHMIEKTAQVEAREQELLELKKVLTLTKEALEKQANIACNRESMFDSRAAELHSVINTQDRDIKTIQEDIRAKERRIKALYDEVSRANSVLARTEHDLVQAKRQHSATIGDNKRQNAKLNQLQDEISRLRAELQAAQEELVSRNQQISCHLQSITEKGSQIAGLRASKSELEQKLANMQIELANKQSRCAKHLHAEEALEETLQNVSSDLEHAREELSVKVAEAAILTKRLSTAQSDTTRLENMVSERDDEIKSHSKLVKSREVALERSKQQLQVLESHLNGHDTLLEEYKEKEEMLAAKCDELDQSENRVVELQETLKGLNETVAAQTEEVERWNLQTSALEARKAELEKELLLAAESTTSMSESLESTTSTLKNLEKSTAEEIAELKNERVSLQKALDNKDSSLTSASEVINHNSVQGQFAKEQLIESRTRGDRLFERLTAAEYELASKTETLLVVETRLSEMQEKLHDSEREIERLERNLQDRNQELSRARSRVDEAGAKTVNIAQGEILTMRTKLEAKEKAIANLHNWCCFINGKLHATEKALSEQQVDLEVSTTAFKKLEARLQLSNDSISQKEAQIRNTEAAKNMKIAELRSRIETMEAHIEEANMELGNTERVISEGGDHESRLVEILKELQQCKEKLQARDLEVSQAQAQSRSLQEALKKCQRDFSASQRSVESLTLDVARLRAEENIKRDAKDSSDKKAAMEVSKVRSETGYLLFELRQAEADLAAANDEAKAWQSRAEQLQPLAESTLEAQRSIEMLSSRLALAEKDSSQRIDLLQTQLEDARRERDVTERDCAAALADCAAVRARLSEAGSRYGIAGTSKSLCAVTFTLEGATAPSPDIAVYILGNDKTLGGWDPSRRLPMRVVGTGQSGVVRKCDVLLSVDVSTSYKFAADGTDGSLVWEGGENRLLSVGERTQQETHDVWRSPL